jgi:hypothetical protein
MGQIRMRGLLMVALVILLSSALRAQTDSLPPKEVTGTDPDPVQQPEPDNRDFTNEQVLKNMIFEQSTVSHNEALSKNLSLSVDRVGEPSIEALLSEIKEPEIIPQEVPEEPEPEPVTEIEVAARRKKLDELYGFGTRVEVRSLKPGITWQKSILDNAESVGIVIERSLLHKVSDSLYQLDVGMSVGQRFHLCPGEAFADQPVIGTGTAFVCGQQTMLTAGHVLDGQPKAYAVIFGFDMINRVGAYQALIPAADVYFIVDIETRNDELDVLKFKTDRVINRPVLKIAAHCDFSEDSRVYMIGHPMGLPKKVALNAGIRGSQSPEYFHTTLDAYQGNSGSPVFDFSTNEVIGIFVSGEVDYRWNGSCNESTTCQIPFCDGEKAIKILAVRAALDLE